MATIGYFDTSYYNTWMLELNEYEHRNREWDDYENN